MKHIWPSKLMFVILVTLAVFAASFLPVQAAEEAATCVIRELEGEVVIQRDGGEDWQEAAIGDELKPGDTIQTRGTAKAGLLFVDGSIVRLRENSVLKIKTMTHDAETGETKSALKMLFGKVLARVQKLTGDDSMFEVETPTSVAAVKGTIFRIYHEGGTTAYYLDDAEGGNGIDVRLLDGSQQVEITKDGQKIIVDAKGLGEILPLSEEDKQEFESWGGIPDYGALDKMLDGETAFALTVNTPEDSSTSMLSDVVVAGSTTPGTTVKVNGQEVVVDPDGDFTTEVNLTDGWQVVTVVGTDAEGNEVVVESTVYVNTSEPVITVTDYLTQSPFTNDNNYSFTMSVADATPLDRFQVRIVENQEAGEWFDIAGSVYTHFPKLSEGNNDIEIYVRDRVDHEAYHSFSRFKDTIAPIIQITRPTEPVVRIPRTPPQPPGVPRPPLTVEGFVIDPGDCANPGAEQSCPVEVQVNGIDVPVQDANGFFSVDLELPVGEVFRIQVEAYDYLRNKSQTTYTVFIGE